MGFDKSRATVSGEVAVPLRVNGNRSKGVNPGKADNQCIAFQPRYFTRDNKTGGADSCGDTTAALSSQHAGWDSAPCVAFTERTRKDGRNFECQEDLAYALTNPGSGGRTHSRQLAGQFGVRRLTPTECERLMGVPDGWTSGFSDSCRYRMLGNSVAVSCVQWIAKRIAKLLT